MTFFCSKAERRALTRRPGRPESDPRRDRPLQEEEVSAKAFFIKPGEPLTGTLLHLLVYEMTAKIGKRCPLLNDYKVHSKVADSI